ncbi:MAG: DegT/DnrJ/EryC1/StrS family aminotransferase, partial [Gammaproteobacteria bacterium]|nr:DegT/DnrJ/EryC1/StrS family aminotransferase [Gammaproteobacteria bacterium]
VRSLRNHGTDSENLHSIPGYNSRMDEIHAAVLRVKLGKVRQYIVRRRGIARLYCQLLADLPVELPHEVPGAIHVFNQFTILTEDRDYLAAELQASNIATAVYYPLPLYRQPLLSSNYPGLYLPVAERVAKHCLSLPVYPELEDEYILKIVNVIENALKNKKPSC